MFCAVGNMFVMRKVIFVLSAVVLLVTGCDGRWSAGERLIIDSVADTLHILLIIAACSAAYCFIVGEITRNNSQMDKLWSILPAVYTWVVACKGGLDGRLVVMAVLATVWGVRLTFNFAKKGAYSWKFWTGKEDYRWPWLRAHKEFQPRWRWVIFNLLFISIYQNLLVLLITLPAVAAMGSVRPFGWMDLVAALLMGGAIFYEALADLQQWRFQSKKWRMIKEGRKLEELPEPYRRGFNTSGLWRYSRHPNYLGEQTIWVAFYLFSVAAGAGILNWSICGAVLLILLFVGSSTLGEYISKSKYPEYAEYVKRVNRFIPGRPY